MQMRIVGNVWLSGRAYGYGEVLDLPEPEAERLAVLGVAEPVSAAQPRHDPEPVEAPEMAEEREAVDLRPAPEMAEASEMAEPVPAEPTQPAPEPTKPKRKRGKR